MALCSFWFKKNFNETNDMAFSGLSWDYISWEEKVFFVKIKFFCEKKSLPNQWFRSRLQYYKCSTYFDNICGRCNCIWSRSNMNGGLISEGILTLVQLPIKGAKSLLWWEKTRPVNPMVIGQRKVEIRVVSFEIGCWIWWLN